MSDPKPPACARCGGALDGAGRCPSCLLGLGLGLEPEAAKVGAGTLDLEPGDRVGPYTLLERIGEGGMGVVFLAEQSEPIARRVALKVLKPGLDSAQVLARFEGERRALALMDHPNIARVLDAGATPAGHSYFVMEHVQGPPITAYCDQHRLTTARRLELFVKVCRAIHHAHQKGVLHRDIKPSNVLVETFDDQPQPKVIDFGVAKAIQGGELERSLFTEYGVLIGTPSYMSPEQASGSLDLDVTSDVYALGVLLYELLTSALPFDPARLRASGYAEMQRILLEEEPEKPSTYVGRRGAGISEAASHRDTEPGVLRRQLQGDLDWIVLKTLEKDRARRYQAATELAADLLHHLRDEPVTAGPPSAAYRVRKFARRYRLPVTAALLVLCALLVGGALSLYQASRARAEARRAEAVSDFLTELLGDADPDAAQGHDTTVKEVLDRAARRIENELNDQPRLRNTLQTLIGKLYRRLGRISEAEVQLRHAMDGRERRGDTLELAQTAEEYARVLVDAGRYQEAEDVARRSLAIRRRLLPRRAATASSLEVLASARAYLGDIEESRTLLSEALQLERTAPDGSPMGEAGLLRDWAQLELQAGQPEEAERRAREALVILRRASPRSRALAAALETLAHALEMRGQLPQIEEAERHLSEALEVERSLLGEEHPEVAFILAEIAATRATRFDFEGGEQAYAQALAILRETLGPEHPEVATLLNNIAVFYHRQRKWQQAADYYRQSLALRRRVLGPDHPLVGTTEAYLGLALHMGGDPAAEATYRSALAQLKESRGEEHPQVGNLEGDLARLLIEQGRYREAERLLRQALGVLRPIFGMEDQRTDNVRANLGLTLCTLSPGGSTEGEGLLRDSLAWRQSRYPEDHWTPAEARVFLAVCEARAGRRTEALPLAREAYRQVESYPIAPKTAVSLCRRLVNTL